MKKIFTYFANNGGWNGYYTRYVVAESAEEYEIVHQNLARLM